MGEVITETRESVTGTRACARCYRSVPVAEFDVRTVGRFKSTCATCVAQITAQKRAAKLSLLTNPTWRQLAQAHRAGVAAKIARGADVEAPCPYHATDPRHDVWMRGRG